MMTAVTVAVAVPVVLAAVVLALAVVLAVVLVLALAVVLAAVAVVLAAVVLAVVLALAAVLAAVVLAVVALAAVLALAAVAVVLALAVAVVVVVVVHGSPQPSSFPLKSSVEGGRLGPPSGCASLTGRSVRLRARVWGAVPPCLVGWGVVRSRARVGVGVQGSPGKHAVDSWSLRRGVPVGPSPPPALRPSFCITHRAAPAAGWPDEPLAHHPPLELTVSTSRVPPPGQRRAPTAFSTCSCRCGFVGYRGR
jgi:hypothetical protein